MNLHVPTREMRMQFGGFCTFTDRHHVYAEFEAQQNKGQSNTRDYHFEIHVSLAPFPSLKGPKTWVVDRVGSRQLSLAEFNEILKNTFDIDPVDFQGQ